MAACRRVYDSRHPQCRLTAKNWDQLRNPTLGSRVWATFLTKLIILCPPLGDRDASQNNHHHQSTILAFVSNPNIFLALSWLAYNHNHISGEAFSHPLIHHTVSGGNMFYYSEVLEHISMTSLSILLDLVGWSRV